MRFTSLLSTLLAVGRFIAKPPHAISLSLITVFIMIGCGAHVPQKDAMRLLLEQLTIEETRQLRTCHDLQAKSPESVRLVLDDVATPTHLKNELLHEARIRLSSLFNALEVQEVCQPNHVLNYYLKLHHFKTRVGERIEPPSACKAKIDQRFQELKIGSVSDSPTTPHLKAEGTSTRKIFTQALLMDGISSQALLDDPLQITRALDLSPAFVNAVLTLAEHTDQLAQRLSSVIPVGGGIARIAIDRLAAELIAVTLERVLQSFESQQLVSRVAVSRHACLLTQRSGARSAVAQRVLRRLILRFDRSTSQGTLWDGFCEAHSSVCSEMMVEAQLVRARRLPWSHASPAEMKGALNSPTPKIDYSLSAIAKTGRHIGELLQRAASGCAHVASCTLSELGARASVIAQLEARSSQLDQAREGDEKSATSRPPSKQPSFNSSLTQDPYTLSTRDLSLITPPPADEQTRRRQLSERHQKLSRDLRSARVEVERLHTLGQLQRSELERSNQLLGLILSQMKSCRRAMESVKQKRLAFARDHLKIPAASLSCQGGLGTNSGRETAQLSPQSPHLQGLSGVSISTEILCDPLKPFTFNLNTEGLFTECSDELNVTDTLDSLADLVGSLKGSEVLMIGHADQTLPQGRCALKFRDNLSLSRSRARVAGAYLSTRLSSRGTSIHIKTLGVGASSPLRDCSATSVDRRANCHQKNRRIDARIISGSQLNLNPTTCASPAP